jgi:hypothetical protein
MAHRVFRHYFSLVLLFLPPMLFGVLIIIFRDHPKLKPIFNNSNFPWQLWAMGMFGMVATAGGVLDWKYHRNPLNMRIPKKERDAEAAALGLGGLPMSILMWFAMLSNRPSLYLIPILLVLIYTVAAICYDEFVFHLKRCTAIENTYHRMLVFGNGTAWICWFHFIYNR